MGVIMLLLFVIVVAATASIVTIAVMRTINSNRQSPPLGPPRAGVRRSLPPPRPRGPAPWEAGPGPEFPQYPALRLSAADRERVMILLAAGKKIHAVKLYRDVTGASLKEAKDAVEHMERYQ